MRRAYAFVLRASLILVAVLFAMQKLDMWGKPAAPCTSVADAFADGIWYAHSFAFCQCVLMLVLCNYNAVHCALPMPCTKSFWTVHHEPSSFCCSGFTRVQPKETTTSAKPATANPRMVVVLTVQTCIGNLTEPRWLPAATDFAFSAQRKLARVHHDTELYA